MEKKIVDSLTTQTAFLLKTTGALADHLKLLKEDIRFKAHTQLENLAANVLGGSAFDPESKLRDLIAEISLQTFAEYSESRTRKEFIDPILGALGWDLTKRKLVGVERKIDNDAVADYVLYHSTREAFAIVEAKNLYEPLAKHETQLFTYMDASSADTGILTNGFSWFVYKRSEESVAKKVFEVADILTELTPESASELCQFIGFQANHHISKPKRIKANPTSPLDDGWVELG